MKSISKTTARADASVAPTGLCGWPSRQTAVTVALLSVAGLLAYSNSFKGDFVFDDIVHVIENPQVHIPWRILFPLPHETWNRPFAYLTFALNYALDGANPRGYHAVNLAIHLAAGITLYLLIRRTLSSGSLAKRWGSSAHGLGLATALLWLVHPLQTQSVTYVYQRQESLMGLFYLATILGFAYGVDARSTARQLVWWAVSVICCALGMVTKEAMVTAPLMVLWYDRAFIATSWGEIVRRRWGLHLAFASTWGVLFWMMRYASRQYVKFGVLTPDVTPWEYARSQPGVILHYLRLCFWPQGQCLDYAWPVAESWGEILPASIVIVGLLVATIWAMFRKPALGFLGGWFFMILAPTSSIAPIVDLAFEHRMYLPLAAVVLGTVLLAFSICDRRLHSVVLRGRVQTGALICAAVALGITTYCRNEAYQSFSYMWEDVLAKSPRNLRAHHHLAAESIRSRNFSRALSEARLAAELNPRFAPPRLLVAEALFELKRPDEALVELNTALQLDPLQVEAYRLRARLFLAQDQFERAAADFARAAELDFNPRDLARDWLGCGRCRMNQNRPEQAVDCYLKSINYVPDTAETWYELGRARWKLGELPQALESFQHALDLRPGMAECYLSRGTIHGAQGRHELAVQDFSRAIELRPELAGAHSNRAVAYYHLGEMQKSWADVQAFEQQTGQRHPLHEALRHEGQRPN